MNAEQIVRKYSDMVYGIAIRYVRNRIDADDVYNDVFYRYFRRERTFASEEHRKNWLIRVSVNAAKDFLIKKRSDVELRDDMFEDVRTDFSNVSREELMDLRDGLKKLKEEYREIIELYYINGFNTKEISVMLQKSENTVKSQLLRGRQKLREVIE
ncbi:RNA polymerase sigma-70 factor, ECF subfamily [Lachnospiraceae bacterium C10]|nr:RNA polymerase sigma-70 factor, ECF subfamily [Lachnospiraceae bacterium C10]